jgi:hypothetical protein
MNNRVIGTVASKKKDKQPKCTRNANKASGSLQVISSEAFIELKKKGGPDSRLSGFPRREKRCTD